MLARLCAVPRPLAKGAVAVIGGVVLLGIVQKARIASSRYAISIYLPAQIMVCHATPDLHIPIPFLYIPMPVQPDQARDPRVYKLR